MADELVGAPQPVAPAAKEAPPGLLARMRESQRLGTFLWPLASLIAIIALWEWASSAGVVDEIIVPPPSAIWDSAVELAGEDFFWDATWVTTKEAVIGFAVGVFAAWVLGTLIGLFRVFRLAFYPLIIVFQIMPRVALAPVFLTWFGFGITSKWVMAATICFFPVMVNVILGIETVDKNARNLMRSFGASRWEEYRKLVLPYSLPAIFASLKVAITLALIGAVVGEFVGATEGMAVLIKTFNFQLNVADGFAVILYLSLLGLILYGITVLLESRIVFWRGH
jgi:NitT/TauT family transport system permease protein